MNRYPLQQALTWLLVCVSVLMLGMSVRLAPVEKTLAWPLPTAWPGAQTFLFPAALALATVAAILLVVYSGSVRGTPAARPWGELLLFYPAVFAFEWLLLTGGLLRPVNLVVGGLLLAAGLWLLLRGPVLLRGGWETTTAISLLDGVFILTPAAVGLLLGQRPMDAGLGLSFFLYPLYALVQLGLFLKVPVARLRAMGVSAPATRLLAAIVFALIHWPNPLVMLATLVAMFFWADQYQRGRPLWQLALVMGLAATTFSQMMPDRITHHVRVGPGYVRAEAIARLGEGPTGRSAEDAASFLNRVFPLTVGRPITAAERENLVPAAAEAWRHSVVQTFLSSVEYRNLRLAAGKPLPPGGPLHWSDWPEPWVGMVRKMGGAAFFQAAGGDDRSLLVALYHDLLGRTPSPAELDAWQTSPSAVQRRRWVEFLLDHRLEEGDAPVENPGLEVLRLWL